MYKNQKIRLRNLYIHCYWSKVILLLIRGFAMSINKIQSGIIEHLLKHGQVSLLLPDGMELEIGITQEEQDGKLVKKKDYCWVIASHNGRSTSIDPYNMGLRFYQDDNSIILEDNFLDFNGEKIKRLDVV